MITDYERPYISGALLDRLREEAARQHLSINEAVREAVKQYLDIPRTRSTQ